MTKQCKDCRWFNDSGRTFECRRFPPAYQADQDLVNTMYHSDLDLNNVRRGFPFVTPRDWCGEWTWTKEAEQAHQAHLKKTFNDSLKSVL